MEEASNDKSEQSLSTSSLADRLPLDRGARQSPSDVRSIDNRGPAAPSAFDSVFGASLSGRPKGRIIDPSAALILSDDDGEPVTKRGKREKEEKEEKVVKPTRKERAKTMKTRPSGDPMVKSSQPTRLLTSHAPKIKREPKYGGSEYDLRRVPKVFVGRRIDLEVAAAEFETLAEAQQGVYDDMAAAAAAGTDGEEWPEDYIIATVDAKMTELVIKFTGYGRPSMVVVDADHDWTTKVSREFRTRMERLNKMMGHMRRHLGDAVFDAAYPNVYAQSEPGYGDSAFVESEVNSYKNRLRAKEWRDGVELDKHHQPPVYYENWTGNITDVPIYEYTTTLKPSKKVQRALSKSNDLGESRCDSSSCGGTAHDACTTMIGGYTKGRACTCHMLWKGKEIANSPVECTDDCDCDPEECGNRLVQKGRQHPVCVFYDHRKQWTLRTLATLDKGEFVGELTGEVLTSWEETMRPKSHYTMAMPEGRWLERNDGKGGVKKELHRALSIDASAMGNEMRFVSHSCVPNCDLTPVYVERSGKWYARMTFVTNRRIRYGEELTVDYFPRLHAKDTKQNVNEYFDTCWCDAGGACKFRGPLTEEKRKERKQTTKPRYYEALRKEATKRGDSWSEGESEEDEGQREEERSGGEKKRKEEEEMYEGEVETSRHDEMEEEDPEMAPRHPVNLPLIGALSPILPVPAARAAAAAGSSGRSSNALMHDSATAAAAATSSHRGRSMAPPPRNQLSDFDGGLSSSSFCSAFNGSSFNSMGGGGLHSASFSNHFLINPINGVVQLPAHGAVFGEPHANCEGDVGELMMQQLQQIRSRNERQAMYAINQPPGWGIDDSGWEVRGTGLYRVGDPVEEEETD